MIAIFPEIENCVSSGRTEQLVCLVRQYFAGRLVYAPALDPARVLEGVGIGVSFMSLDSMAALLARDEKGAFRVALVLNEDLRESPDRNFMMAHLMGHYFLHIQPRIAAGEFCISGFREDESPMVRYVQRTPVAADDADQAKEEEADRFAAALLMPAGMVRRAAEKLTDPVKLAAFFGVTRPVMQRRLETVGLAEERSGGFLAEEDRLGTLRDPSPGPAVATRTTAVESPPKSSSSSSSAATNRRLQEALRRTSGKALRSEPGSDPARISGMDRIREIARRLDKGMAKPGDMKNRD